MIGADCIRVRLGIADARVVDVDIHYHRGPGLEQLLVGRSPDDAPRIAALVHRICGQAHAAAAVTACGYAQNLVVTQSERSRRRISVLAEHVTQHAFSLLVDWPNALGESASLAAYHAVETAARAVASCDASDTRSLTAAISDLSACIHDSLKWRASRCDLSTFEAWMRSRDCAPARLLDGLRARGYGGHWDAGGEQSDGTKVMRVSDGRHTGGESGPVRRYAGHPLLRSLDVRYRDDLLMRLVARVVEYLNMPHCFTGRLQFASWRPVMGRRRAANIGTGQVETARGRLLHRVELADGTIRAYKTQSPTEWNFRPRGPLWAALMRRKVADVQAIRAYARLTVMALDPCVACDIEVA